jgi:hypothetical protein
MCTIHTVGPDMGTGILTPAVSGSSGSLTAIRIWVMIRAMVCRRSEMSIHTEGKETHRLSSDYVELNNSQINNFRGIFSRLADVS